jgi:hypothetical protein
LNLGYEDDPPLTAAARERLAKRFGCDPKDVEECCRRLDDASWVGQLDSAISSATSAESEKMSREIADGAVLGAEAAGLDLSPDGTPEIDATGPPPIPGPIRLPTASDAVVGTIDLSPTVRALDAATVGEMEQIEREIERGAEISHKEIRARLDLALRGVKMFAVLAVALLAGLSSFASNPCPPGRPRCAVQGRHSPFLVHSRPPALDGGLLMGITAVERRMVTQP